MKAQKSKTEISPARLKFAKLLLKLREQRGYPTAYAFFHKNGGAKHFGFSYHHYLLIEKGMRLPSQESFKAICELIGGKHLFVDDRDNLLKLYVKALLGGDSFFDSLFEEKKVTPVPVGAVQDNAESELLRKMARGRVASVPKMSDKQMEAAISSSEAFWIYQWLYQTGQRCTIAQLAQSLKISEAKLAPAIEHLVSIKLVEKKRDEYFSPYFQTGLFAPSSMSKKQEIWWAEQILRRAEQTPKEYAHFYPRYLIAIEDHHQIATLCSIVREAMDKVYLFRPSQPVSNGTLVCVESRVSALLPIGE